MTSHRPHLIIITGRPAAGKSTMAAWLSRELGLPFVSKDTIREVLFGQLGWQDRPWAQKLGRTSLDLMFYFAEVQFKVGGSLILDNAFDPVPSTPKFKALQSQYNLQILQIICNADSETLWQRFVARAQTGERHPGHGDEAVFASLQAHLAQDHSPQMDIEGGVIHIDTTDFAKLDYPAILKQVMALMQR